MSGTFSYISASQFAAAARQNEEIAQVKTICCGWLLAQSRQLAACNAVHSFDARFSRWILQSAERLEGDVIPSTYEIIAQALGVRSKTVSKIAQGLQLKGMISYRPGKIRICNREGLRTFACECFASLGRANWPFFPYARTIS
jgi:CRP-like cAMP-binding protein